MKKQISKNVINCPVCKTSEYIKFKRKINEDSIYVCTNCELGMTIGNPFDILETPIPKEDSKFTKSFRKLLMDYEFGFLWKRPKSEIFEIGSGNGDLTNYLISLGHVITSSDTDINYRNAIKKRFGIKAIDYDLLKGNDTGKKYDIVILRHVFEHVDDPVKALKNIKKLLKPGGQTVILSPNFNSWGRYIGGEYWTWNLPEHRFHWTEKSLKRVMQEYGFKNIKARGVFSPFGLPLILGKKIKSKNLRKLLFPLSFMLGSFGEFIAIPFKKTNNIFISGFI